VYIESSLHQTLIRICLSPRILNRRPDWILPSLPRRGWRRVGPGWGAVFIPTGGTNQGIDVGVAIFVIISI